MDKTRIKSSLENAIEQPVPQEEMFDQPLYEELKKASTNPHDLKSSSWPKGRQRTIIEELIKKHKDNLSVRCFFYI